MAISDILSTSFLFSIAIIIILIGGVFAYVSYRMGEQDHKLNSMIGLVSTMAEESQFFRSKLNMLQQKLSTKDLPVVDQVQYASQMMVGGQDDLINVSDDEDDDSDDESDDLEDDESDDLEDKDLEDKDLEDDESEDLEDDESEDLDDDESEDKDLEDDDLEDKDLEEGKKIYIKRLNLTSAIDESPVKIQYEEIDEDNNSFKETNNLVFDSVQDLDDFEAALEEADFQLLAEDTKDDDNFLKNVSITGLDNGILSLEEIVANKNDYKKMSLNKLREVVVSKGFTSDASHLKKNQILKLLGDE
jgi:hypothetical protein